MLINVDVVSEVLIPDTLGLSLEEDQHNEPLVRPTYLHRRHAHMWAYQAWQHMLLGPSGCAAYVFKPKRPVRWKQPIAHQRPAFSRPE